MSEWAAGECNSPLSESPDLNPDCGFSFPASWHESGDLCRASTVKSPGLGNARSQQGVEAVDQGKQCVVTNLANDMENQTQINRGGVILAQEITEYLELRGKDMR